MFELELPKYTSFITLVLKGRDSRLNVQKVQGVKKKDNPTKVALKAKSFFCNL